MGEEGLDLSGRDEVDDILHWHVFALIQGSAQRGGRHIERQMARSLVSCSKLEGGTPHRLRVTFR